MMLPYYSFDGLENSCVTRVRFSPLKNEVLAVGVDSSGYVRLMDLQAQRSANYNYDKHLGPESDVYVPHLCDFSFNECGKCIYVASSDGSVSISALNMIGSRLDRRNKLFTLYDTHIGGTFCVYPSPEYDFMIYTGGGDGYIRQWDLRLLSNRNIYSIDNNSEKQWSKPLLSLWAHIRPVSSMSLEIEKHILTCGFGENLRMWSADTFTATETLDSRCEDFGIWDVCVNTCNRCAVAIGDYGSVWTFSYDLKCKDLRRFHFKDGVANEDVCKEDPPLFIKWRRICVYGNKVVIPTVNKDDYTKGYVIDVGSGEIVDRLLYPEDCKLRNHNIASVDAHPNLHVGLLISGGGVNSGMCTVWLDELSRPAAKM